jgi:cytoskeletal protein CcmA (bactofilin family)
MTFLGKDVIFEGILTMEGDVRLDGRLRGELHTTGTLTVGEDAIVKGTVEKVYTIQELSADKCSNIQQS